MTLLTEVIDPAVLERIRDGGGAWCRPVAADGVQSLAVRRVLAQASTRGTPPTPRLVDGWMIEPVSPVRHLMWLHGSGHVGRAIAATLAPLPDWAITWVDTGAGRFPSRPPEDVDILVARDPARAVAHAPVAAHHLILTYSHALDLALCDAVLRRGFATAGLIGSATKWARFRKRLAEAGHAPEDIARIACPIGDPRLGKHPQAIAVGVVSALLAGVAEDESRVRADGSGRFGA